MATITPGKHVELAYEIMAGNPDGTHMEQVYKFSAAHPDSFIFGHEPGMLQAFEQHLQGLEQGQTFDFTLSPEEAFGPRNPEMVVDVPRNTFVVDGEFDTEKVFVGAYVPMRTADGQTLEGFVQKIDTESVTLDFNHQLAGHSVRYRGTVTVVRDATAEELSPKGHHCCGHCHDEGGECKGGECDCQDGDCEHCGK